MSWPSDQDTEVFSRQDAEIACEKKRFRCCQWYDSHVCYTTSSKNRTFLISYKYSADLTLCECAQIQEDRRSNLAGFPTMRGDPQWTSNRFSSRHQGEVKHQVLLKERKAKLDTCYSMTHSHLASKRKGCQCIP